MLELKPANFEQFEREAQRGNVVPVVRTVLADLHTPVGAVGYLAYDAARWFEPVLKSNGEEDTHADDAVWMFFRNVVAFDRVRLQMEITSLAFTDAAALDSVDLRSLYEAAVAETARIEAALSNDAGVVAAAGQETTDTTVHFQSNWPRQNFEAAVETVKQYIAAGDCYQVVIAQQFTKPTPAPPLSIYRALRATNPSPYMYFLRLGHETIIGASPEMLVRCHDQRLDYRPIAGTRNRGATEPEDWMLAEEMRNDEK